MSFENDLQNSPKLSIEESLKINYYIDFDNLQDKEQKTIAESKDNYNKSISDTNS